MRKLKVFSVLCLVAFCGSCQKYYLSVCQERVDRDSLASTYVGSPDPRQANPPLGEQLIVEWQVPKDLLKDALTIALDVVYKDYEESSYIYPISHKNGSFTASLLDEDYRKKKGFLSYKAEIRKGDGSVFRTWTHQLWVQLIHLEESQTTQPDFLDQPKMDIEEEESATFFPPTS
jgi:hypothetical protein